MRCAILLGYDPATGAATIPVAAAAWDREHLAVSWIPFTAEASEPWHDILATVRETPPDDLLEAAASRHTTGLLHVTAPPVTTLRDAAELLTDTILAAPTSTESPTKTEQR